MTMTPQCEWQKEGDNTDTVNNLTKVNDFLHIADIDNHFSTLIIYH